MLFEKNAYERRPMASTTKIMSVLLVLESGEDLDKQFVVDSEAIKVEGSSMGLQDGDKVTLRDLCCGMLLPRCKCCCGKSGRKYRQVRSAYEQKG